MESTVECKRNESRDPQGATSVFSYALLATQPFPFRSCGRARRRRLRASCKSTLTRGFYKWNEKGAKDGLLSFIISEEVPREIKMKAIGQQVMAPISTSPCFGAGRKRETI